MTPAFRPSLCIWASKASVVGVLPAPPTIQLPTTITGTGRDWLRSARLGSVMGAIKIEQQGAQNHRISREAVAQRYELAYGSAPW